MMKLLAIDTSTEQASIALKYQGIETVCVEKVLKKHAEWLLPTIDVVLKEAAIKLQDLDGIVFGQGPGRFTGVRVACSIAKGLAYASQLPLYPVSSLASVAVQVSADNVLAVIDARMQAWYWASFQQGCRLSDDQLSNPEAVIFHEQTSIVLAGVGFDEAYAQLNPALKQKIVEKHVIYPSASSMIAWLERHGGKPVSAKDARPQYCRQQVIYP